MSLKYFCYENPIKKEKAPEEVFGNGWNSSWVL